MATSLPLGVLDVEILAAHERHEAGAILDFRDEGEAYRFLHGVLGSPRGVEAVRALLAGARTGRDLARAPGGELLTLLAREVAAGRLCVAARPPRRVMDLPGPTKAASSSAASSSSAAPAAAPVEVRPASAAPAEAAPAVAEAAADDPESNTDAAAQAEALKEAAENGTPFCEECEKARRAREAQAAGAAAPAAPPPPPPAGTSSPAPAPAPRPAASPPPPARTAATAASAEDEDAEARTDPAAQAQALKEAAENGTPFCEECEKARRAREGGGDDGGTQPARPVAAGAA